MSNLSYKAKIPPSPQCPVRQTTGRRSPARQNGREEGPREREIEGERERERGRKGERERWNKERVVHQGECDAKDARKSFCSVKGYLHL